MDIRVTRTVGPKCQKLKPIESQSSPTTTTTMSFSVEDVSAHDFSPPITDSFMIK